MNKFECEICGRSNPSHSKHLIHQRVHTGEKPFSCNVCNKKFNQRSHLKSHFAIHTELLSAEDVKYRCKICHKNMRTPSGLLIHERVHTGEKPFSCDTCKRAWARKFDLKKHICSLKSSKTFVCTICNNSFLHEPKFKRHLAQFHDQDKEVDNSFKKSINSGKHIVAQTGVKPYSCSICKKAFKKSNTLSVHMKIHKEKIEVNDNTHEFKDEIDTKVEGSDDDEQNDADYIVKSENDTLDDNTVNVDKNADETLDDFACGVKSDNDSQNNKSENESNDYRICSTCRTPTIFPWDVNLKIVGDFSCDRCILKTLCNKDCRCESCISTYAKLGWRWVQLDQYLSSQ